MDDECVDWDGVEIESLNEEAWYVLVLYARIAVSIELLELCDALNTRTGKKRRKVVRNIVRVLDGEDCEAIEA